MPVRVLVVEDSLTVRRYLCDTLRSDPDVEVAGEASDGKQGIHLCETLRPDIVTMDMMLPVMSGLAATEYIMAHCPTPILVVSSSMNRGEVFKTYEALAAGAVDVLEKPTGSESAGEWEGRFLAAVKLVSRIHPITHVRGRIGAMAQAQPAPREPALTQPGPRTPFQVVAIGASTGGPGAILQVLRALPRDFPLPILLVLHISEPFAEAFAQWLDGQTGFRVSYALDNQPLSTVRGQVTLAPPGSHLEVRGKRMRLTSAPERHSCRPSIDVLFESLAAVVGASTAACLLTGMGRDGAAGLLEIRRAGGLTIAQDEETSVVYGMPREAMLIGAAERILPLAHIGPSFAALVEAPAVE
jgi:two-component system, chemotaxis family, protein-glutamate methylesterase/glutaminase